MGKRAGEQSLHPTAQPPLCVFGPGVSRPDRRRQILRRDRGRLVEDAVDRLEGDVPDVLPVDPPARVELLSPKVVLADPLGLAGLRRGDRLETVSPLVYDLQGVRLGRQQGTEPRSVSISVRIRERLR
jgi:hypothetical protein